MAYFERKDDYGYIRWAQEVKRRDHFACVVCGRKGVHLNSHHLNAWASFPGQRYDVDNGVTLCSSCHDKYHEIYGKGKNTKEQFEEYMEIVSSLIKAANKEGDTYYIARKMLQEAEKDLAIQQMLQDLSEINDVPKE